MDLPGGLTARAATFDDLDAIVELLAACEEHDDGMVEIERSDLTSDWRRPGIEPAQVTAMVLHGDRPVGFVQVISGRVEGGVHPGYRRRGIGTALLRRTWELARADRRPTVGQTVSDSRADAAPLFARTATRPRITHGSSTSPSTTRQRPAPPDGCALRPMDVGGDATRCTR